MYLSKYISFLIHSIFQLLVDSCRRLLLRHYICSATLYVMCFWHSAFCSLLFFFVCFLIVFICGNMFTINPHILFRYIFRWWILSLYHFMMIHSYLPLSVKQFVLLFYYFSFVSVVTIYFPVLFSFVFPYCGCNHYSFYTTAHSCFLLCTPFVTFTLFADESQIVFFCILLPYIVKSHLSLYSFFCDTIFSYGIQLMIYIWAPTLIYIRSFKKL